MRNSSHIGYAAIGLYNPRNPLNVGGVLRAASCFGASMVAISGRPYKAQRTDTARTHLNIPILHVDDLHEVVPFDCVPIAIERIHDATPLPEFNHPDRAFYIFGPENGDLGKSVTSWCGDTVVIPSDYSINLAAAVNIVLYDRLAKAMMNEMNE